MNDSLLAAKVSRVQRELPLLINELGSLVPHLGSMTSSAAICGRRFNQGGGSSAGWSACPHAARNRSPEARVCELETAPGLYGQEPEAGLEVIPTIPALVKDVAARWR